MTSSIEAWILMSLVYRDLDDRDYENALLLAERLYAIDTRNTHYLYIYGLCLFYSLDYTATYTVLQSTTTTPSLHLFAKSCLELGKQTSDRDRKRRLWEEGTDALRIALKHPADIHWGEELTSMTIRQHMPSTASLYQLLGDLNVQLDNIRAASQYYWKCLRINPYKLSVYMKLCDIAPDYTDLDINTLPEDIFSHFQSQPIDLSPVHIQHLPPPPSSATVDLTSTTSMPLDQEYTMPPLKSTKDDLSVQQLKSLIYHSHQVIKEDLEDEYERGDIENKKDAIIHLNQEDIKQMKKHEAYSNKHGLHQKPPHQTPQELTIDDISDDDDEDIVYSQSPPSIKRHASDIRCHTNKRIRYEGKNKLLQSYFTPTGHQSYSEESSQLIMEAMHRVLDVIEIIGNGYMYQSFYYCRKAAMQLQKLDHRQYNTPTVLYILGKAYYDAGDHQSAHAFFRHSFLIAPWYCDGVPMYSTCLWYLQKEKEANLLAYKMKDNVSHRYESYIAAGNWNKCRGKGSETIVWLQKAVELDPTRSYGHGLLGYEEWEKGNNLGAKEHFANCVMANKRSYIGWYGMGTAYLAMEEYKEARTLLEEAVRLHPTHPVVLATYAEVLNKLDEHELARKYIEKSLKIREASTHESLREKINKAYHESSFQC